MENLLNTEIVTKILLQLVVHSPYAEDIITEIPKLASLVKENDQLQEIIERFILQSDFKHTHDLNISHLSKKDKAIIQDFFEYIYFSSDKFLKEVK